MLIALTKSIQLRLESVYTQQMHKVNWLQFQEVCEQQYLRDIVTIITAKAKTINLKINSVYWILCCNKFVAAFVPQYFANICKLKRISEVSAH